MSNHPTDIAAIVAELRRLCREHEFATSLVRKPQTGPPNIERTARICSAAIHLLDRWRHKSAKAMPMLLAALDAQAAEIAGLRSDVQTLTKQRDHCMQQVEREGAVFELLKKSREYVEGMTYVWESETEPEYSHTESQRSLFQQIDDAKTLLASIDRCAGQSLEQDNAQG